MCSGRVDLGFIFRAFSKGQDGVFIGGCKLNECNYITHGNYDALGNVYIGKKLLKYMGLDPGRLRIEFMSSADGMLLVEYINDFVKKIKALGPLGKSEGIDRNVLNINLNAVKKLVPYIRLVERERMRVPVKSREEYDKFFTSDEAEKLFNELIADKLAISQIVSLLRESPLSTGEIARNLGLTPSDVSKHLNSSSRQGLVRYNEGEKRFALA